MYSRLLPFLLLLATGSHASSHHFQHHFETSHSEQYGYGGNLNFAHMPYSNCLQDPEPRYDVAIVGFPFDTATSYRPGARFGPFGIRSGSRRLVMWGIGLDWGKGPLDDGLGMLDCGDVRISTADNERALEQMQTAYSTLVGRPVLGGTSDAHPVYTNRTSHLALDGKEHPRLVTLGGDHTITLPILRSLYKIYGPISVIHFDAHLDTSDEFNDKDHTGQERINHGSFFTIAAEEGLLSNTSIHAGVRSKLRGLSDISHDTSLGFQIISAEDIEDYGIEKVIEKIRKRVGNSGGPVYLSLSIDVIDPGLAPGTGAPEVGGWTTREMRRILRGLSGLNFVGADIVEVAPSYDHAEITSIIASDLVWDFLVMMQLDKPPKRGHPGGPWGEEDLLI